ncbi:MAG: phosphatidylserine/phosphatidylglycerophosphate/cardiolipin synthase family protein [Bdellovibrionota bacterium]
MSEAWQSERLFFEGDDFLADLAEAIGAAKQTILIETYIYRPDAVGRRMEQLLRSAALRGIKVKLLVDGIGSLGWIGQIDPQLETAGVQVRIYHPVYWGHLVPRWERKNAPTLASRLNRRTHRKMAIIDEKIAYVGSVNMTAEHSREASGPLSWRDTVIRVSGDAVADLVTAFDNVWRRSHDSAGKRHWKESLHLPRRKFPRPSSLVRLNFTRTLRARNSNALIDTIESARAKLWITNAYFAPSGAIVRAILNASQNGADVRLLVPRNSDVFFMPWIATSHYKKLLKAGVRVFEYLPRFLHAKTMIIDEQAMIGTSNLNRRSLFHDFEVDLFVSSAETRKRLEDQFLADLEEAEEITSARGGPVAFLGRWIARLLKTWV